MSQLLTAIIDRKRYSRRSVVALVITLSVGIAVSLIGFVQVRSMRRHEAKVRFVNMADQRFSAIARSLDAKLFALESLYSLLLASGHVDRDEFTLATDTFLAHVPAVRALAWIPRVRHSDRVKYEMHARKNGVEQYEIKERNESGEIIRATVREYYYPVDYVEPYSPNEEILGLDLATNPEILPALTIARDSGKLAAAIARDNGNKNEGGLMLIALRPLYERDGLTCMIEGRRESLRGFVGGAFKISELIEEGLAILPPAPVALSLLSLDDEEKRLHLTIPVSDRRFGDAAPFRLIENQTPESLTRKGRIEIGGRTLLVCCSAPKRMLTESDRAAWWMLAGGLALTAALGAYLFNLGNRTATIERLVDERTHELQKSNARIDKALESERATSSALQSALEELETAKVNAEAATRAKSEFLANVSHEIRTPMTAILGFTDVLLEHGNIDNAPPERIEAAQTIKRNGKYLIEVINDILDLSKVEAGKMGMEMIACDTLRLIAAVTSLVKIKADGKNLTLAVEYEGVIPETILTDPTRLRQILINLVGNAVKFTESGTVRLITKLVNDDNNPYIQFDVVDSGIGMTAEQTSNLFRPFSQADASTTRKFGGTGLGLTISKRLAEMLGGDIEVVESTPGGGTRMRATVATGPLDGVNMISDPLAATCAASDAIAEKNTEVCLRNCRILLAEDGPDNQQLISHVLKKAGASVTIAENGELAVEKAEQASIEGQPFDVILMDMQMPKMDGYAATGLLRQRGYDLPIIALTAHAMATDRQKCLDAGCTDYASKPLNRKKLIATIDRHLQYAPA